MVGERLARERMDLRDGLGCDRGATAETPVRQVDSADAHSGAAERQAPNERGGAGRLRRAC